MSQLIPDGLEFHQVSKERWKEFCDAVQHLDHCFQELLQDMSESEKKSPIGGRVLLCQQAHAKVMSTFCEMGKQESVKPVPKVHAQAVPIKKEVEETQLPNIKKVVEEQPVNCKPKLSELPKDVKIKKEVEENQLPAIKKVVEENQIESSVREMKVKEMELKEEQPDEDMFPMNLNDKNLPDPSEMKCTETYEKPDHKDQKRLARGARPATCKYCHKVLKNYKAMKAHQRNYHRTELGLPPKGEGSFIYRPRNGTQGARYAEYPLSNLTDIPGNGVNLGQSKKAKKKAAKKLAAMAAMAENYPSK